MFLGHTYDIRAEVKLKDGRHGKVRVQIEARCVTSDELIAVFTKEVEWRVGSKIVQIDSVYDANDPDSVREMNSGQKIIYKPPTQKENLFQQLKISFNQFIKKCNEA
jgi:hypothetical protein